MHFGSNMQFGSSGLISCTLGLICNLGLRVVLVIVFVFGNTSNIWRPSFPPSPALLPVDAEAVYSSTKVCQRLLISYSCCMFLAKVLGCACTNLFRLKTLRHKVSKVTQMLFFVVVVVVVVFQQERKKSSRATDFYQLLQSKQEHSTIMKNMSTPTP